MTKGVLTRYDDSEQQFRASQHNLKRQMDMKELITGERNDVTVPQPGEFLLVSKSKSRQSSQIQPQRSDVSRALLSSLSATSKSIKVKSPPQTSRISKDEDVVLFEKSDKLQTILTTDVHQIA